MFDFIMMDIDCAIRLVFKEVMDAPKTLSLLIA